MLKINNFNNYSLYRRPLYSNGYDTVYEDCLLPLLTIVITMQGTNNAHVITNKRFDDYPFILEALLNIWFLSEV